MAITAQQILDAIRSAVEPLDYVNAMWLGGSQAFGEDDEYSDLDIQIDVSDGCHEDAFAVVEAALERLSPMEYRWRLPEPTWHGHSQALYRLADTPEWLLVDFVVMQRNTEAPRLDEREIHGAPVIVFDKLGVIKPGPLNPETHRRLIFERVEDMKLKLNLFSHFPGKEILRGRQLDALWRYNTYVLGPLLAVLRAKHSPYRYNWGPRYLKRDLPGNIYLRLSKLTFVADEADLAGKVDEAIAWAMEEFATFDIEEVKL